MCKGVKIRLILFFVGAIIFNLPVKGQEFSLAGEYQGKNLYVQNPLSKDNQNFCTDEVYLNDERVLVQPKTSAFEIKLDHLNIGDPVVVRITYKSECLPKIINPQVIRSKSRFQFEDEYADLKTLSWITKGEQPNGKFIIEHYRNEKWVAVETIRGKGSFEYNQYSVTSRHHSGNNKYRVKYLQSGGKVFFSKVMEFDHDIEPVTFFPTRVTDKITFSREADYEILDTYGNLVDKGSAQVVSVDALKSGLYYLNIDNRTEKFVKK